jgi:hypothetical protein
VDAEEAALPDEAEGLEEDEFFAAAGGGGAAAGHRFFGDDAGGEGEPQWHTNELFVDTEEGGEAQRPQSRAGRPSTGTPRGGGAQRDGPRSLHGRKGGAAGAAPGQGLGKRKFSGDGGSDGAPPGKRQRPEAQADRPQRQGLLRDAFKQLIGPYIAAAGAFAAQAATRTLISFVSTAVRAVIRHLLGGR